MALVDVTGGALLVSGDTGASGGPGVALGDTRDRHLQEILDARRAGVGPCGVNLGSFAICQSCFWAGLPVLRLGEADVTDAANDVCT